MKQAMGDVLTKKKNKKKVCEASLPVHGIANFVDKGNTLGSRWMGDTFLYHVAEKITIIPLPTDMLVFFSYVYIYNPIISTNQWNILSHSYTIILKLWVESTFNQLVVKLTSVICLPSEFVLAEH